MIRYIYEGQTEVPVKNRSQPPSLTTPYSGRNGKNGRRSKKRRTSDDDPTPGVVTPKTVASRIPTGRRTVTGTGNSTFSGLTLTTYRSRKHVVRLVKSFVQHTYLCVYLLTHLLTSFPSLFPRETSTHLTPRRRPSSSPTLYIVDDTEFRDQDLSSGDMGGGSS